MCKDREVIYQCDVHNTPSQFSEVRQQMRRALSEYFTSELISRMVLATEEALVNVFKHGYGGGNEHGTASLTILNCQNRILIEIEDSAPFFDPSAVPMEDPEARLEQGLSEGYGLVLIRTIMHLRHERRSSGNRLIMEPKLDSPGGQE